MQLTTKGVLAALAILTSLSITVVVMGEALYIYLNSESDGKDNHKHVKDYADFQDKCTRWELRPDTCDHVLSKLQKKCADVSPTPYDRDSPDCWKLLDQLIIKESYRLQLDQELTSTSSWVLVVFATSVICMGPACGCLGALLDDALVAPVMTMVYLAACFGGFGWHTLQTVNHKNGQWLYHLARAIGWCCGFISSICLLMYQWHEFRIGEKVGDNNESDCLVKPPKYPNYGSWKLRPKAKMRKSGSAPGAHEDEEEAIDYEDEPGEVFGYGQVANQKGEVFGYGGGDSTLRPLPPMPPPAWSPSNNVTAATDVIYE